MEDSDFRVSGRVNAFRNNAWHPDAGAVVLFLPESPEQSSREDPATITPQNFQPLENPTIDAVRLAGGHIVRSNSDGDFELFVEPGKYHLITVSNAKASDRQQKLQREQVATLSQFFLPVENLIERQDYVWKKVDVSIKDIDVGIIEFR